MKKVFALYLLGVMCMRTNAQSTVSDFDGNVYQTVTIGSQVWMKQNLRADHYADGTLINNSCWYNNTAPADSVYGKLYPWSAAMKNTTTEMAQGACPTGWHVPSEAEWVQLFDFISDSTSCAYALKSTDTAYWNPTLFATNTSGFSMIGAGSGYNCSFFDLMKTHAEFWTSTQIDGVSAKNWSTNNQSASVFRHYNQDKANNFSVRCVNNLPAGFITPPDDFDQSFLAYINATGQLVIKSRKQDGKKTGFSIYTADGRLIQDGSFANYTEIQIKDASAGMYIISVSVGEQCWRKKIVW